MSLPYWIENLIPAPWSEYWENKPANYLHAFRLDNDEIRYVHIEKKGFDYPDDEYDSYRYIMYDKLTKSMLKQITTKFKYSYYEQKNEIITYGQDKEGHPVWFGVKFVPDSLGNKENIITYTITTPYNTVTHNLEVWGTGVKEDNVSLRRKHAYQQHEFGAGFDVFPGQGFNFYEWLEENPEYKDNRYILGGETYYWGMVWVPNKDKNHFHKLFMPKDISNNRQDKNVVYVEHKTGRLVLDSNNLNTRLGLKEKILERMETIDSNIDQLLIILSKLKEIVFEQYCEKAQETPSGLIYAIDDRNQLVTIDPISGKATVLTDLKFNTGERTDFKGIAFDYNGIMWGIDTSSVYAINFNTGYCFKAFDLFNEGYQKLSVDKENILYTIKSNQSYSINTTFKTEYEDYDISFLDSLVCQDFDKNGVRWLIGSTDNETNNSLYIFNNKTNQHQKLSEITEFFPDLIAFHITSNSLFGFSNNNRDVYEIELDNEYSIKNYIDFDSNNGEIGYLKCLTSWSGFTPRNDRWLELSKEQVEFINVKENSTKINTLTITNLSPYSEKVRVETMSPYFFVTEMDQREEILLMPSESEAEITIIFDATRLIGSETEYEANLKLNISGTNNDNQYNVILSSNVEIEPLQITEEINYNSVEPGSRNFSEEVIIYNPASFSVDVKLYNIISNNWELVGINENNNTFSIESNETMTINPVLNVPINPTIPFYDAILQIEDLKRKDIHSIELKSSTQDEDFLEITPKSILFSDVILNTSRKQNITIKSLSNYDKYVYIDIDHPDYYKEGFTDRYFRIGDKNILKFLLKSRQEVTKELEFTPYLRETSNYDTKMTAHFERSENIYDIGISATSSPVPFLIEPSILEFGDREVGITSEHPEDPLGFYLTNISSDTFSFINIVPETNDFEIYGPIPETIQPDDRFFIGVKFRPESEGLKDSHIQISKMEGEEIVKVETKGLALAEGTIQIGYVSLAVDPPIVGADNLKWGIYDVDAISSGTDYEKDFGNNNGTEIIVRVSEDIDIQENTSQEDIMDIDMIEISPGEFKISNSDDEVFISNYNIGKYPITNREFLDVVNWAFDLDYIQDKNGEIYNQISIDSYEDYTVYAYNKPIFNPYYLFDFNGNNFSLKEIKDKNGQVIDTSKHPVVLVSWYGAVCFCNWLSQINGRTPSYNTSTWELHKPSRNGYRLPTEAEWEKAAGWDDNNNVKYEYAIGDDDLELFQANFHIDEENFEYPIDYKNTMPIKLVPVDWYDSNSPYGCYSMAGNATEWCHDWFNDKYPDSRPLINPFGSATGTSKTVKNGNYTLGKEDNKISIRSSINPEVINLTTSFRIVKSYTTEQTSDITELINPIDQGARWRFKNKPEWNKFGKVTNIEEGNYTIQFLPLKGFKDQPDQDIYVQSGNSYEVIANYQFRWNDPSYTEHEYPIGNYKTIWVNEETQEPIQEPEETTETTGNNSVKITFTKNPDYGYSTQFNYLSGWRMTTGPDTSWKNSGETINNIPDGTYKIKFNEAEGYKTPKDIVVELNNDIDLVRNIVYEM